MNARVLAQDIKDAYYQDFADDNEAFFELDYFQRRVSETYAALLNEEYIEMYKLLRQDGLHLTQLVSFDGDWLKTEDLEVKPDGDRGYFVAQLKEGKIFSFVFDQSNVGLQNVRPYKRGECKLVRSTSGQQWIDEEHTGKTDVTFYWPGAGGKIYFDKDCCKKVTVDFVPNLTDDLDIKDNKAEAIMRRVLALMMEARRGQVVNTTNDSNPIVTLQTEANTQQP